MPAQSSQKAVELLPPEPPIDDPAEKSFSNFIAVLAEPGKKVNDQKDNDFSEQFESNLSASQLNQPFCALSSSVQLGSQKKVPNPGDPATRTTLPSNSANRTNTVD